MHGYNLKKKIIIIKFKLIFFRRGSNYTSLHLKKKKKNHTFLKYPPQKKKKNISKICNSFSLYIYIYIYDLQFN